MRPQGFGQTTGNLDDLGWNDMGFEPPKPSSTPLREVHAADEPAAARVPFAGLTPLESPVHSQQAELAERLWSPVEIVEEPGVEAESAPVDAAAQEMIAPAPVAEQPANDVPEVAEPLSACEAPVAEPVVEVAAVEPQPVLQVAPAMQAPRRAPSRRSAPGSKAKAAFTLRLDPERHLKLRLACAIGARSAQQLVTDALDHLLAGMPELDAMAEKAKRKGS
jgi:hypothetical protein